MTFTRLRVGTPSFASTPPRRGAPCSKPRFTGETISDPGLESQISVHTGGPNGDEIPTYVTAGPIWPSDSSGAPGSNLWLQGPPISSIECIVSSSNSRSDTYHLRWQDDDGTKASVSPGLSAHWLQDEMCDLGFAAWISRQYTARVDPSDLVTWGGYFTASDIGGTPPTVDLTLTLKDKDGGFNGQVTGNGLVMTTSYVLHTIQMVAPADTVYCTASWTYDIGDIAATYIDGDDFTLSVL